MTLGKVLRKRETGMVKNMRNGKNVINLSLNLMFKALLAVP